MTLSLAFGFNFADLYDRDALSRLDGVFLDQLRGSDMELANRLLAASSTSTSCILGRRIRLAILARQRRPTGRCAENGYFGGRVVILLPLRDTSPSSIRS